MAKANGCIFVKDWACSVDGDDVPLEVCRICVEARKTKHLTATVNRTSRISEPIKENPRQVFPTHPIQDAIKKLSELDKQFEDEEISLEEYMEKRKNIVENSSESQLLYEENP